MLRRLTAATAPGTTDSVEKIRHLMKNSTVDVNGKNSVRVFYHHHHSK